MKNNKDYNQLKGCLLLLFSPFIIMGSAFGATIFQIGGAIIFALIEIFKGIGKMLYYMLEGVVELILTPFKWLFRK